MIFDQEKHPRKASKMDYGKAIITVLGLQEVDLLDFKIFRKDLRIEAVVQQRRGKECRCLRCGGELGNLHEWYTKKIKGPPLGVFSQVVIKFKTFRAECRTCRGNRSCKSVWIYPKHRSMTCGFVELSGRMMEEMTCEATARLMHSSGMQMMRVDQTRMRYMAQSYKIPGIDYTALAADEVHFRSEKIRNRRSAWSKRWEQKWITNLVDAKLGKVLFNAPGRNSKALRECFSVLSSGQKMAVEYFASDMHEPFISEADKQLPNAKLCVDRFHTVQGANRAFDQVRKEEFRKAQEQFQKNILSGRRRFILVSREKDITSTEQKWIEKLRGLNRPIDYAMLLVEYLHEALDQLSVPSFRKSLVEWYRLVRESGLKPFRKFASTIRYYRELIENYITSRLTTAVCEGINNKIKTLKRMGYGYKNKTYFRHKILQRCGFLNSSSIPTDELLFKVPNPVKC
jgi:transposase